MAETAQERGQHPEITRLADAIVEAQEGEISELEDIHGRLFGEPAGSIDFVSLTLSDEDSGMDMDMTTLADAEPFDDRIGMALGHRLAACPLPTGAELFRSPIQLLNSIGHKPRSGSVPDGSPGASRCRAAGFLPKADGGHRQLIRFGFPYDT